MTTLGFVYQSSVVARLLTAAVDALPHLPENARQALDEALRPFERQGVALLWSLDDVDTADDYALTDAERRETLARFLYRNDPMEADWILLDACAREVRAERVACLRVEYDAAYQGGDYRGSGRFALLPWAEIDARAIEYGVAGAVAAVFRQTTGLDPVHIVHYALDELYNQHGECVEA